MMFKRKKPINKISKNESRKTRQKRVRATVKGSSKGRHSLKTITAIKKVKKSVLRYL